MTPNLQLATMHLYRALSSQRLDWGGSIVLLTGAQCVHTGAPPAVSIAGGTSLALDPDAAAMKAALRAGHLDFVVNSLDEALRALKNEVRQRRPLGVGLIAGVDATLAEMSERGIQPDLRLTAESCGETLSHEDDTFFAAIDPSALREIDTALGTALPADDRTRRRWLQHVPQFLPEARAGGRWMWLSEEELATLASRGITHAPRP